MGKKKLMRLTTVDLSLDKLIRGQLRYLNQYFDVVGVAADQGLLQGVAIREGIRVIDAPMHREISLVADVKSLWTLYKLMRRERPDILHCNTPKGSLLGLLAGKLAGVPNRVYTVTGLRYQGAHGLFRWLLMTMERISCACATKVIPEGQGVLHTLQADKITGKPLQVLHFGNINGIDTSYYSNVALCLDSNECFEGDLNSNYSNESNNLDLNLNVPNSSNGMSPWSTPTLNSVDGEAEGGSRELEQELAAQKVVRAKVRRDLNLSDDDFVFVFVGRIVKDKGINELVASLKQTDCKTIMVGSFDDDDPIDAASKQWLETSDKVRCVGWQEDVRPYLAAADALVFPSYREGFPNVPIQAGALGIPCIVTNINGCNEIIKDNLNGKIIVAPLTSGSDKMQQALESTMQWFVAHSDEVRRMGRNARGYITTRYEHRDVWEATRKMYEKLLK